MGEVKVVWTEYMKYRIGLRGFRIAMVEHILRYSSERYADTATGRVVAIGRHDKLVVMIPYDREGDTLTPVTIHSTTRKQINSRVRSGRFTNE